MIYTDDHEPMHVHAFYQGASAIIEFADEIRIRENRGLSRRRLSQAVIIVRENRDRLIKEWRRIYG